jgi:predicted small lipoprotein YifL
MAGRQVAERNPIRRLCWVVLALLAGCGQKGPLYLPDEARGIVTRPASAPGETQQSPSTPATTDAPQGPANPAPEVTAPEPDKDKKHTGAKPPQS